MQWAVEQINGREGETATFIKTSLVNFSRLSGGFAPRHLNHYIASEKFGLKFSKNDSFDFALRDFQVDWLKMTGDITNHCTRAAQATLINLSALAAA